MQERDYTFAESVVFGVGSGLGLGARDRGDGRGAREAALLERARRPQGLGITFVTAG